MDFPYHFEPLGEQLSICVTREHKFGTDAFLLADFASPRRKDFVCDLGTGCGIIPLLFCKNGQAASIRAVDIQPKAIEQLAITIDKNGLGSKLEGLCADLKELEGALPFGIFDIVTCNPPYKASRQGIESLREADRIARHEITCTLDDIAKSASQLLKFGGRFCICQRPERLPDAITAMRRHDMEPKRIRFVQQKPDTAPWLFLMEGKKGSHPFLKVEKPLIVEGTDGFSEEMLKIYGCQNRQLLS